jgi:hypothetical protein
MQPFSLKVSRTEFVVVYDVLIYFGFNYESTGLWKLHSRLFLSPQFTSANVIFCWHDYRVYMMSFIPRECELRDIERQAKTAKRNCCIAVHKYSTYTLGGSYNDVQ